MIVQGRDVANWIDQQAGTAFGLTVTAIGELRDGHLIAGIGYGGYSGPNVYVNLAVSAPPSKAFWFAAANYPFNDLGVNRITALVKESNKRSIHILERLGFECECWLEGASEGDNGAEDTLVYRLWKKDCKLLRWGKNHGQQT
jgi:RimJ/RimL family protein N-acetyltransferase